MRSKKRAANGNSPMSRRSTQRNKQPEPVINLPTQSATMAQTISLNADTLINLIPNFDEKKSTNIKDFIEQIEELTNAANLPDSIKIILVKNKISGRPRELLNNLTELNTEKTYEAFKKKLIDTFQKPIEFNKTQSKFMELKQAPNQSISDFEKIFNITSAKYLSDSGHEAKPGAKDFLYTLKLNRFLDAIRSDLAFEVRKCAPQTYEQAVKLAKQIESAYEAKDLGEKYSEQTNTLCDSLMSLSKSQSEQINMLEDQIKKLTIDKTPSKLEIGSKQEKWCHICKLSSHQTENCWHNTKSPNARSFKQYNRNYRNVGTRQNETLNYTQPQNFNMSTEYQQQTQTQQQLPLNYFSTPQQPPYPMYNTPHYATMTTPYNAPQYTNMQTNMQIQPSRDNGQIDRHYDTNIVRRPYRGNNYRNSNGRGTFYKTKTFNATNNQENY